MSHLNCIDNQPQQQMPCYEYQIVACLTSYLQQEPHHEEIYLSQVLCSPDFSNQ